MSVKFQEEITKTTTQAAGLAAGPVGEAQELLHEVGEALTKGGGTQGYLAVRAEIS